MTAEGVNLQDCSVIVNYDLPWNPMRLVQRVGRVDRIGSTDRTSVFNIAPDIDLEAFLSLLGKLETKISDITRMVGKESYTLSEDEEIDSKDIGRSLREARMSMDYNEYESRALGRVVLNTDESHEQKLLAMRRLMEEANLTCCGRSRNPVVGGGPYSMVRWDQEPYAFALFRIYDKTTERKVGNHLILKTALYGTCNTVPIYDRAVLRLLDASVGVPQAAAISGLHVHHGFASPASPVCIPQ